MLRVAVSAFTSIMLAMLLLVPGAVAAPLTGPCPNLGSGSTPLTPLPPSPGNFDFCGALDTLSCSLEPLGTLAPEIASFASLTRCLTTDINGPLDMQLEIPVTPNGILDGECELGLVAAVLNNTSYNQNGLTHAATLAAFNSNFNLIKNLIIQALNNVDLGGGPTNINPIVDSLAPHLKNSLSMVLAGFSLMGDPTTDAAIVGLLGLLSDIGVQPPDPDDILQVPGYFGPNDDLDNDGCTNIQEHFLANAVCSTYVANAQNPNVAGNCGGGSNVTLFITGNTLYEVGDDLRLTCNVVGAVPPVDFQWRKNGVDIPTGTNAVLQIPDLCDGSVSCGGVDDSGVYDCVIQDAGAKATYTSPAVQVTVGPVGSLPAGGLAAIGLASFLSAVLGATLIRRRS